MARRSAVSLIAAVVVGLTACGDPAILSPTSAAAGRFPVSPTTAEPGRYLVGFTGPAAIPASVLAASGGQIVDAIPEMNVLVVDGVTNPDALMLAQPQYIEAEFEANIEATGADMLPVEQTDALPNQAQTPWFSTNVMWDMKAIRADDGWARTNAGAGVRACIVDTGIDANHQELGGRVLMRANFVTTVGQTDPSMIDDTNGHGSHVAGTVAGGGVVVSGVAPAATVLGARVLNTAGSGSETAIVRGIRWCADNAAHVINASIGGIRYKGQASYISSPITYGNAVKYANDRGAVVVISAGNSNLQLPNPAKITVPAQVPGTIIVGATGPLTKSTAPAPPNWNAFDLNHVWRLPDNKAYYSNYGTAVHVFAPGGRGSIPFTELYRFYNGVTQGGPNDNIWSLCSGQTNQTGQVNSPANVPGASGSCLNQTNRYIQYAGTSMAAPHVAGLAAVLYSEIGGAPTVANRLRVENCIKTQTDDIGPSTTYGGGRINVQKAVDAMRAGAC
jgi:lantibiotic leader peptide-processing serine protease